MFKVLPFFTALTKMRSEHDVSYFSTRAYEHLAWVGQLFLITDFRERLWPFVKWADKTVVRVDYSNNGFFTTLKSLRCGVCVVFKGVCVPRSIVTSWALLSDTDFPKYPQKIFMPVSILKTITLYKIFSPTISSTTDFKHSESRDYFQPIRKR